MKQLLTVSILLLLTIVVNAQQKIKLEEVNNHVGDSVEVIGIVSDSHYAKNNDNSPCFLNIGGKYPNQKLAVVIWEADRKNFNKPPEEEFINSNVRIIGKIELYKSRPEIIVHNYNGISIMHPKKESKNKFQEYAMASENNFQYEFTHQGINYIAHIITTIDLPVSDLIKYSIQENSFLVKLFSVDASKTFELFIDEHLNWNTNASRLLIGDDIIQLIGKKIDDKTM
jgi:hypothetical protein